MPTIAPVQSVTVGDVRVTFLPDGGGALQATALYPFSTAEGWQNYPQFLDENDGVVTSIGGYLIETGNRKVIVDTGLGPVHLEFPGFGPMDGGNYLQSLAATGVSAEEVTDVIFTHMHLDHVGWTTAPKNSGRALLYPNARHVVTRTEWDLWYGSDQPAGPHPEFVQKPLEGIIQFFAGGDEVVPGVKAVDTPGHTLGHVSLIVTSGDERLILTADLFHCAVQLLEPGWSVAFDMDMQLARASREKMLPDLCKPHTLAAVNHFSNQVFGHFSQVDGGYRWTPLS